MRSAAVALSLLLAAAAATAQSVAYNGRLGDKAVLVVDGVPRTLAVGASVGKVRLVGVDAEAAVVEIDGRRATLPLGAAQANLGGADSPGGGTRIVLTADGAGHFVTPGTINGRTTSFLVDTGATSVALGRAEAERLGIDWKRGQRGLTATANGTVEAHRVTIGALRVGDVTVYEVAAVVLPLPMPHVLLGNSYLTRFQMKRENTQLTLDRRY